MLLSQVPSYAFRNNSGEQIPPYGCMEIETSEALDADLCFVVKKPTAAKIRYGDSSSFIFNGGEYVPSGARGEGYFPSPRVYGLVLTATTATVDEFKHWLAPVSGQWYLDKGWIFQLAAASDPNSVHVEGTSAARLLGLRTQGSFRVRTSTAVTAAGGGTVTMYKFDGSFGFATASVSMPAVSFIGDVAINKDCLAVVVNNSLAIIEVC